MKQFKVRFNKGRQYAIILSRARGLSFLARNEELLATMKGQMYKRICNKLGV